MPKLSEMLPSRFLKKDDVQQPALVTVADIEQVNVAPEGKPAENKWTMTFNELDKPLVLNSTNMNVLASIYGDDSDGWLGKQIVIYHDPNVSFGGKLVGGLRLRAPKNLKPAAAAPSKSLDSANAAAQAASKRGGGHFDDMEDDIPF